MAVPPSDWLLVTCAQPVVSAEAVSAVSMIVEPPTGMLPVAVLGPGAARKTRPHRSGSSPCKCRHGVGIHQNDARSPAAAVGDVRYSLQLGFWKRDDERHGIRKPRAGVEHRNGCPPGDAIRLAGMVAVSIRVGSDISRSLRAIRSTGR